MSIDMSRGLATTEPGVTTIPKIPSVGIVWLVGFVDVDILKYESKMAGQKNYRSRN